MQQVIETGEVENLYDQMAGEEAASLPPYCFLGTQCRDFGIDPPLINRLQGETPVGSDSESGQLFFCQQAIDR